MHLVNSTIYQVLQGGCVIRPFLLGLSEKKSVLARSILAKARNCKTLICVLMVNRARCWKLWVLKGLLLKKKQHTAQWAAHLSFLLSAWEVVVWCFSGCISTHAFKLNYDENLSMHITIWGNFLVKYNAMRRWKTTAMRRRRFEVVRLFHACTFHHDHHHPCETHLLM